MQEADEPAGVADGLLEPDDGLSGAGTVVGGEGGVFGVAERFVGCCDGEDEQEGVGWAGKEGEQGGVGEGVDVVVGDGGGEAELADQVGHYFRVVLCLEVVVSLLGDGKVVVQGKSADQAGQRPFWSEGRRHLCDRLLRKP